MGLACSQVGETPVVDMQPTTSNEPAAIENAIGMAFLWAGPALAFLLAILLGH